MIAHTQRVEERLLEFVALYPEVTTSDLQGMAAVVAAEIVNDCQTDLLAALETIARATEGTAHHVAKRALAKAKGIA